MALDSGLSTTRAAPSPRTYPFARSSKVKHRPSGDSPPNFAAARVLSGLRFRFTPPARAAVHSPASRLSQARCTATSEED
jgi:hypothetical protein